ncbi:MAG TPA: glycosyltransferase [Puia sp.]
MLILLDCRPLLEEEFGERSHIIFSSVAFLARERGVSWLFLVDLSGREDILEIPPGARVIKQGVLPGKIGRRRWYSSTIPRLAKKHSADWVMLTGGIAAAAPGERYVGLQPPGQPEEAGKFILISPWPSEAVRPLSTEERDAFKQKHVQGKEFFWADAETAGEDGVVQLLKAFSLFKKRQLSNLQLVLAGSPLRREGELKKLLDTYKYRQDLHWWGPAESPAGGREAAYAQLFPFKKKTLGTPLLDAWKAEVPVVVGKETSLPELAGDGALVADMSDPASMAGHLMVLYKDERLRRNLIEKGSARLQDFDARASADRLWAGLSESH